MLGSEPANRASFRLIGTSGAPMNKRLALLPFIGKNA